MTDSQDIQNGRIISGQSMYKYISQPFKYKLREDMKAALHKQKQTCLIIHIKINHLNIITLLIFSSPYRFKESLNNNQLMHSQFSIY